MNRLQSELHRLYLFPAAASMDGLPSLFDASMQVRALVVEVARPASWEVLARVWQGVQAELELPAPAIAVSGSDGLQLWFALAEAIPVAEAHDFLEALRLRFLPDIPARRIRLLPAPPSSASAHGGASHAAVVPAQQAESGNWSAFVASDLAPVFADTPWLDIPPSEDGQAGLLRGLRLIKPAALEIASARLGGLRHRMPDAAVDHPDDDRGAAPPSTAGRPAPATGTTDPRRFLLQVMNDDTVALGLRIDAARALLSCRDRERPENAT